MNETPTDDGFGLLERMHGGLVYSEHGLDTPAATSTAAFDPGSPALRPILLTGNLRLGKTERD